MKKCEKCGTTGADDAEFCVSCGGKMIEAEEASNEENPVKEALVEEVNSSEATSAEETPDEIKSTEAVSSETTPVSASSVETPKQKMDKNTLMMIGMIIAVLIGVGGLIFGIVMANSKGSSSEDVAVVEDDEHDEIFIENMTDVTVGKWVFSVPESLDYAEDNGGLWLSDDGWKSYTSFIADVDYAKVIANPDAYAKTIASAIGVNTADTGEESFGDEDFMWMDFNKDDKNVTYAFSEADDAGCFVTAFVTDDYTIDHEVLDEIGTVLTTATEKDEENSGVSGDSVFDLKKVINFSE